MRLFIAILFNDEVKGELYNTVLRLKKAVLKGSFTKKENLHLTVSFIGETKRVEEVKQAMLNAINKTMTKKFSLSFGGLGKFIRKEGDIYWVGVEKELSLWRLQRELVRELKEAGFYDIDDREYKPHLTLGRRVNVDTNFSAMEIEAGMIKMQQEVGKLSLMKSERIEGELVYTEIYHVNLEDA